MTRSSGRLDAAETIGQSRSPYQNGATGTSTPFGHALEAIAAGAALDEVLEAIAQIVNGTGDEAASISAGEDGQLSIVVPEGSSLPEADRGLVDSARQLATLAVEHARLRDAEAGYRSVVEHLPTIVYIADAGEAGRWHYVSPQIETMLGFKAQEFLEDPELWARQLHSDDRDRVLAAEAAVESGGPLGDATAAEYRLIRRDGAVVWIRDDALLARDTQRRLRWHGVLSDITDRKQAEAEAERRAAQQAAVARIGEHALEGADLAELMNEAVDAAARIMDADVALVLELMSDAESFLLRAGLGWGEIGKSRMPTGMKSQSGFTIESGRPVIVTDWHDETRFEKPRAARDLDMRSGMSVIIEGRERSFGVLILNSLRPGQYGPADVDFVQALANVLADAIRRQSTEDDIRHRAVHDSLTQLPNRVLFLDRLGHALGRLRRQRVPVAVLFLDVDNFKLVNDSLGHQAGDDLLVAVSSTLKQAVRPGDTVARFGGDEFGILLEEVSSEHDATDVAQRIAAAFTRPFVLAATEHFVSASVGIALTDSPEQSPEALIRDADAAMYRAKERGRARYELFDEDMRARAVARLRVENDLRRAIDRHELRLEYQPVVSLRDGTMTSVEALVRWDHPERGVVAPGEFIPVAEEGGLIDPIGRWVLGEACRQTAEWHAARPDQAPLGISVNLSARQVAQQDVPAIVARALERTGVEPASLSLEITETVLLDEEVQRGETLRALRAMGVRLVLDDFGTGYSSLGYLTRLPLDALKVDRSFVDGLGTEAGDTAIVRAVIAMARALGLGVIAEGVESEVPIAELRRLGCDLAQGFYFARPLPAPQITELLLERAPFGDAVARAS